MFVNDRGLRRAEIRDEINRLLGELTQLADDSSVPIVRAEVTEPAERRRPLRQQVLDALDLLGVAALSREVQAFLGAVYGDDLDPTRFGSLRREEMRSYDNKSRPRALFICYGLTERGEAIKRLLCRSDWPLVERVVAPTTGPRATSSHDSTALRIRVDGSPQSRKTRSSRYHGSRTTRATCPA